MKTQFQVGILLVWLMALVTGRAAVGTQPPGSGGSGNGGNATNEAKYVYGTRGGGAITLSSKWANLAQTTVIKSNFTVAAAGGYYTNLSAGYYNIAIGGDVRATNNDTITIALEVNGTTNGTLTGYLDYRGASGGVGLTTNRLHVEGIVYLAANTVIRPLWSWFSSTANLIGVTDPFLSAAAVDTSTGGGSGTVDPTNSVLVALISTGAMTNNPNSWYIWAHPTTTNVAAQRYFAQNRGLSYTTNSDDFGGLLQSIFNRGVDGISIRIAASPYYTSHFVVSNTVVITNWFIMEGEGNPVTTIHGKSGMTTPVLQFGDATHFISGICRLNRIRFEGEGTSAGSVGVHVVNCAEPVFEYVEWTGFLMAGLRISTLYNTAWAYADNCWFVMKGANAHGVLFDAEPSAAVIGQNHFSIKNCIFGIHTSGGSGVTVSNRFPGLVIQSSHFRNYSGVSGEAIVLRAGGEYIIQGNQFHNFGATWPITFSDRLAATNYASSVIGNKAWTDGSQGQELIYLGDFVQGVTFAGNEGGTGLSSAVAAAGNNGAFNNFDKYQFKYAAISRTNALVYLDSDGIAQPVTLSGLTFSAPTLTATGGSGGTNFPNVNLLAGNTNAALSAGVRKAFHQVTNASYIQNFQLAVPESGYQIRYSVSNYNTAPITLTFQTNQIAANPYDVRSKTNVNTITLAEQAITSFTLTYMGSGLWLLSDVEGPQFNQIYGTGIYPETNGTSGLDVTISTLISTNYANAATNDLDCSRPLQAAFTNDLSGNQLLRIINPRIGTWFNVYMRDSGSVRTIGLAVPAGVGNELMSTNWTSNSTNILTLASKLAVLSGEVTRGTNGTTNVSWFVTSKTP